jgi:hypothetical protein
VNCCSSTTSGVAVTETREKKWSKVGKTSPEDALSLSNLRFKILRVRLQFENTLGSIRTWMWMFCNNWLELFDHGDFNVLT